MAGSVVGRGAGVSRASVVLPKCLLVDGLPAWLDVAVNPNGLRSLFGNRIAGHPELSDPVCG